MTKHTQIAAMNAVALRDAIRRGDISPLEAVTASLEQIAALNSSVNAVCTVSETALDEARALQEAVAAGQPPGLLHGLPIGIKDVTDTAGLRTTYGSQQYADHLPEEDALVVQRLKAAGAIVVAKTNTPEFAAGGNTFNAVFGATRNPWNLNLSAGGSTGGGAAALASGMVALAEGSDLGGSLRIPASFCGVVGLRPSPGLVPALPSPYRWDSLNVHGPMGRTVADVALMLQAMAGPSGDLPLHQPIAGRDFLAAATGGMPTGVKIAYCPDIAGIGIDAEVEGICRKAVTDLSQAGAIVEVLDLDFSFARSAFLALRGYWMAVHHYHHLQKRSEFGENIRGNIEAGLALTVEELAAAENQRSRLYGILQDLFRRYDYLLTPCMAVLPFPVEVNYPAEISGRPMKNYVDWIAPTFILSLSSLPVGCVPAGLSDSGLPVGIQVVGPPQGEEKVLALAGVIEAMHSPGLPDWEKLV